MENDDARAFSILRVIARLNPSDANTKEELKRLEEKLLRVKLESLRQVLANGDSRQYPDGLGSNWKPPACPFPLPIPSGSKPRSLAASKCCGARRILRQQDAWQEAELVVEEIHALATRYNVRLPEADADVWTELEQWTTQKRAAYASEQDFQRALSALEYEVNSISSQRAAGVNLAKAAATVGLNSLTQKRQEAERFGPVLPPDVIEQCEACGDWLRQQIQLANRRARILAAVTTLVILGGIAAAIPYVLNKARQEEFALQLSRLESARKLNELQKMRAGIPDSWKSNSQVAAALTKAQEFVAREEEWEHIFDAQMAGLTQIAAAGFRDALAQVPTDRANAEAALTQLAPELQPPAKSELDSWDNRWQSFRNAELAGLLNHAEETAEILNPTNGVEKVTVTLGQIGAMLAQAAPLEAQPPALQQALLDRLGVLSNKVDNWAPTAEKWEQVQGALSNASSLDQYLVALDQLPLSPFATPAQKSAVANVDHLHLNEETLLGQLLLPENPAAWNTLTNVTSWSDSLMPEQPTAAEKDLYFKLRDDKIVRDVNAYQLIANARPNNPFQSHDIFVQGTMAPDNAGQQSGLVHDPTIFRDTLHFVHTAYSDWDYIKVKRLYRTLEGDCYEHLGLGELIDPNTGNYQKPILQLFDQLNKEAKASSIFRAYVTLKLLAVAEARPNEWGFQWCPGLPAHLQTLTNLGANELQSGDWLVPERSERLERPLQEYFARATSVPLEKQARFLQQLAHDTCAKGFTFAGFIDSTGRPILRSPPSPAAELCGWSLLWRGHHPLAPRRGRGGLHRAGTASALFTFVHLRGRSP